MSAGSTGAASGGGLDSTFCSMCAFVDENMLSKRDKKSWAEEAVLVSPFVPASVPLSALLLKSPPPLPCCARLRTRSARAWVSARRSTGTEIDRVRSPDRPSVGRRRFFRRSTLGERERIVYQKKGGVRAGGCEKEQDYIHPGQRNLAHSQPLWRDKDKGLFPPIYSFFFSLFVEGMGGGGSS